jgi:hypothetical protein
MISGANCNIDNTDLGTIFSRTAVEKCAFCHKKMYSLQ